MKPGLRKRTSLTRKRARGQSIVLIALILAVLIGLVALSVDVGNTYAQQRAAQRASDAASADAMTALLQGANCGGVTARIEASLKAHGIADPKPLDPTEPVVPGERRYQALFIQSDKDSTPVPFSGCNAGVLAATRYIKVELSGTEQTNFATLFGRNDLPVNSDSFAQRTICPPEPIALNKNAFNFWPDANDPTDTNYKDNVYKSNRPQRRFYLHTDPEAESLGLSESSNTPGQFAWLRWTESNTSAQALASALKPPGTVDQGFQEVDPWGDERFFGKPPDGYPTKKGIPSEFDLMYGAPTVNLGAGYSQKGPNNLNGAGSGGEAVAEQLRWLIDNHVAFNVAEYDAVNESIGSKAVYKVIAFKSYMLVGYGYVAAPPSGSNAPANRGYGWFLDLVQLGKPLECAQGETQPQLTNQKVTLTGTVNVRALYGDNVSGRPPIDMVIVLDASGSMNWTWDGVGTVGTASLKKYAEPNGDIQCTSLLKLAVGCQSADAYKDYKQRKIYQAKQTLKSFMSDFQWGPQDRAAIVTYSGGYNDGPGDTSALTTVYPKTTGALTSDISGLADEMLTDAGSKSPGSTNPSELYTTIGASPGALGLNRANKVLSASSGSNRQRAVVFLTDGLLNVYMNGYRNPNETIGANYDQRGGNKLPTNQAINQATAIKTGSSNPASIFVISLGKQFDRSGLDQVANEPVAPYLTTAGSSADLKKVLDEIRGRIINAPCDAKQEPDRPPDVNRTVSSGMQPVIDIATGQPSAGRVTVKQGGATLQQTYNIGPDGTFRIPDLLPNTDYTLSFNNPDDGQNVFYMGLDTPTPQLRNYSTVLDTGSKDLPVHVQDANISTTQFVHEDNSPIVLVLNPSVDVCTGTP